MIYFFQELLRAVHEYAIEKEIKLIDKPSYGRVREILGISRAELDLLFSVYAKNSNREEVILDCNNVKT